MIKIIYLIISVLIVMSVNTKAIANQTDETCQSILKQHAKQSSPSFTQEETKSLTICAKNHENWCMFYGSNINNCQNNLHRASTTEQSKDSMKTTPIAPLTTPVEQQKSIEKSKDSTKTTPIAPLTTPVEQQKSDVDATSTNNNKTTTTAPSEQKNNQKEPGINWF